MKFVNKHYEVDDLSVKPSYLLDSLAVLRRLSNLKIKNLFRLADDKEDDPLKDYGSLLLETNEGSRVLIGLDEGMNNVFLLDTIDNEKRVKKALNRAKTQLHVVRHYQSRLLPQIDFKQHILKIEIVWRESEFEAWHLMSGIGLTFADGHKVIIGTTLTKLEIQGVWILTPDELSQGWYFDQLRSER
ncbi:MAG: hypothetical protein DRR16_09440 [Candidatus Parabeggiatoa sp. nov. 3]|nr:MAG: hypothetical protein DRR00_15660 [Gammaproteobacteria bacterium]RKZ65704.1 MAG: hypothetical protein DRQ99_11930 [Gammaproteobacteria bacterium]RKZ86537.1 MAG: hypothetical protein DRR16_09440 [Gammaproteobacteria bacterium]